MAHCSNVDACQFAGGAQWAAYEIKLTHLRASAVCCYVYLFDKLLLLCFCFLLNCLRWLNWQEREEEAAEENGKKEEVKKGGKK